MSYLRGSDRSQSEMFPASIEEYVSQGAAVRFIDVFVDQLDMRGLGFAGHDKVEGRPGYHPKDLLKLYVYGYLHRIRSSRRLEAETRRNLEVMWLLRRLTPDFKTIADFRHDNCKCFKGVLKEFNLLCRQLNLFSAELVAIDGSKFKAVNNPGKHITSEGLAKMLAHIEERIEHYLREMDNQDEEGRGCTVPSKEELQAKLDWWRAQRAKRQGQQALLKEVEAESMSLTDTDAVKMLRPGTHQFVVGYNAQLAVDSQHHLIVTADAVQEAVDRAQLAPMAAAAQEELSGILADQAHQAHIDGVDNDQAGVLTVVADAGYHAADQLHLCEEDRIVTYVPNQRTCSGRGPKGEKIFPKEAFVYSGETDSYSCPAGQLLKFETTIKDGRRVYSNYSACSACPLKAQCTTGHHRTIKRSPYQGDVERAAARLKQRPEMMLSRKSIVEHVFGTLRNWGHDQFLMKGIAKVRGELSLSALTYNLRRVLNLFSIQELLETLKPIEKRGTQGT